MSLSTKQAATRTYRVWPVDIDSEEGADERLIQRVQTTGRSGKVHTGGIELKESIDKIFSGSSQGVKPVGQFEMARRRNHGIPLARKIQFFRGQLQSILSNPDLFFGRSQGSLVVLLLAERAPSEGWGRSGQVPFLLAEPPR